MANESGQERCETLADLVADLRAKARKFIGYHGVGWSEGGRLMSLADRIEAAWRREKSKIEADALAVGGVVEAARPTPGNAAAMREALNKVGNAAAWIAESCNDQQTAKYMNDMITIVQTAIAAPARNCDYYDCKTDAETGFIDATGEDDNNPIYWQIFANWLFAPAAERKGDGDD